MLCLSFYEWRCIYPGEQMVFAPFLEKSSLDRAPGRFADYPFVPKHSKAEVLLTTVLGLLRWRRAEAAALQGTRAQWTSICFRGCCCIRASPEAGRSWLQPAGCAGRVRRCLAAATGDLTGWLLVSKNRPAQLQTSA